MKTFIHLTAVVCLLTWSGVAQAGSKTGGHRGGGHHGHHGGRHHGHHRGHHHGHHYGYDYGYGPRGGFVSDPFAPLDAEFTFDPLVGEAEVIRSLGEFNRNTSEALINVEEARQRAIENHRLSVETRYELKRQWRERQAARRNRKGRPQSIEENSRNDAEDLLDDDEFNRLTGEIVWPEVLLDPQFEDYRIAFEQIFADPTTKESGAGTNLHRDAHELASDMKEQLRDQVADMAAADYIAAKKFIDRLRNEARSTNVQVNSDSAVTALK